MSTLVHLLGVTIVLLLTSIPGNSNAVRGWPPAKHLKPYTDYTESDTQYWHELARSTLRERIEILRPMNRRAKNVIIFLGDGMGISTITAARILKGQLEKRSGEEGYLEFDRFPHSALIKTYNLDKQVPDSAGTATAYLTGVKANYKTIGVNGHVQLDTPDCDLVHNNSVTSILAWGIEAGKAAGIVTTTRVTHATPAGTYAHTQNRNWEEKLPSDIMFKGKCKDIATQLLEDYPGNRINVIMGGGRGMLTPNTQFDPKGLKQHGRLVPVKGNRMDDRNLIHEWMARRRESGLDVSEFSYVNSTRKLRSALSKKGSKLKYLMGLFNHTNMEYEQERDKSEDGEPSLTEMAEAAVKVLSNAQPEHGFVLLVEGGRIDHAHHDGWANMALHETVEFDRAIRRVRELVNMHETLIMVTADHSHTLTINGYPARGNAIQGFAGVDENETPFTTLMYGNGPGHKEIHELKNDFSWAHKTGANYQNKYRQQSAIKLEEAHHGGEDVAVFAIGPMAHMFGGTHEQSYIPHVGAYAACLASFRDEPHCRPDHTNQIYTGMPLKPSLYYNVRSSAFAPLASLWLLLPSIYLFRAL